MKNSYRILRTRIKAIEKAVLIANKVMNRRLKGMNEFRAQLDKQATKFITRKELIITLVALIALITLIFQLLK
jgi:hypothetical protein